MIIVFVGLYGLTNTHNSIKIILALSVMGLGLILFFVSLAYVPGGAPPIVPIGSDISNINIVDPVPHSFMITLIVINLATTALGLALVIRLFDEYGSLDIKEMIRWGDDESD
ncbi:MAG: cation:proton antiporter subunit C [Candidatus Saliniplasma sp.]